MEYVIGVVLATVTCVVFGVLAGFDRERIFYPMMLPPVATYYVLFAAMGGSTSALTLESLAACVFLAAMVVGFKKNLWWAAGYNIVGLPLAAGVLAGVGFLMPPAVGAALMAVSTIVVDTSTSYLRSQKSSTTCSS